MAIIFALAHFSDLNFRISFGAGDHSVARRRRRVIQFNGQWKRKSKKESNGVAPALFRPVEAPFGALRL
jgi:hypothetical protein